MTTDSGIAGQANPAEQPGRASSPILSGAFMAASMIIVLWVLMRLARQRRARSHQTEPTARLEEIRHDASQREVFSNLMVDAEELTRRFAAQLDNKAARLEQLLELADERIERLERASRTGGSSGAASNGTPSIDPTTLEIYRLADEGQNPVEIAKSLGQHTGKVELILALREG